MSAGARAGETGSGWRALLRALRPYQWPKNVVVFAAFTFSAGDAWLPGEPDTWWPLLWRTAVLMALWSMAASATYLVNDIRDRELDRLHPRKRYRPIASGAVSVQTAWTAAAVLAAVALPLTFVLDAGAGGILLGYSALMTAYSFGLKQVAILDILILCSGVIGRAVGGGAVIGVEISPWLYVCTGFGAFFFAASKRWAEFRELGVDAKTHRPALAAYSGEILSQMVVISAATAVLAYALYTIESVNVPANGAMALTIPFAAFALFRYLLLLNGTRKADAPDQILFTDGQILAAVAGFVATAVTVMVAHHT